METTTETRKDILAAALHAREQEVMHYQINIDNYRLAIAEIDDLPPDERAELDAFAAQLSGLLASEVLEQKKAQIMLAVIRKQLA